MGTAICGVTAIIATSSIINPKKNEISYNIYKRGFNLPSYFDMSESDIKKISKILNKFIS